MTTSHTIETARELWEFSRNGRVAGDDTPYLGRGQLTVHSDGTAEYHEGNYHWAGTVNELLKEFIPDGWIFQVLED